MTQGDTDYVDTVKSMVEEGTGCKKEILENIFVQ